MPVLHVLLGDLTPLLQLLGLGKSLMIWAPVQAVRYTLIPVAMGWTTFGESNHGVYGAGLPSLGDQAS